MEESQEHTYNMFRSLKKVYIDLTYSTKSVRRIEDVFDKSSQGVHHNCRRGWQLKIVQEMKTRGSIADDRTPYNSVHVERWRSNYYRWLLICFVYKLISFMYLLVFSKDLEYPSHRDKRVFKKTCINLHPSFNFLIKAFLFYCFYYVLHFILNS